MTRLELLAPARNADIGIAAIRCGADAVYIGGPGFGARAAAGNSIGDIARLCDFASTFGVRIFVTVNTLAEDDTERERIVDMMCGMKGIGISAFILQDTTLLPLLQKHGPWDEEFHASTQCAIRTPERAAELAAMGFSRLILERELSIGQIRGIRAAVPPEVELEAFVHGALCVCYSGDCYLSEHLAGRSANRGECAQPCRSIYDLVNGRGDTLIQGKPLLSLKDLCLIDRIPQLVGAGITSFKIEGRLKNESYVKNVTRAYSLALDKFIASSGNCRRASYGIVRGGFTPDLDKTFNRGYTSLFLDGKRGKWNSGDYAKGMGEKIGRISRIFRTPEPHIELEAAAGIRVNNGDGLCFISRGGEVNGFRADRAEGPEVFCKSVEGMYEGAPVWRNRDNIFERELEKNVPDRLLRAGLCLSFLEGSLNVKAVSEDCRTVEAAFDTSDCVSADNRDRMLSMIGSQMGKSAGIFLFSVNEISGDSLPLLNAARLNAIRRETAGLLEKTLPSRQTCIPRPGQDTGICRKHPRRKGELMRSRYCILSELGLCLKTAGGRDFAGNGLFLKNNGRLIPLQFDCSACEMILKAGAPGVTTSGQYNL